MASGYFTIPRTERHTYKNTDNNQTGTYYFDCEWHSVTNQETNSSDITFRFSREFTHYQCHLNDNGGQPTISIQIGDKYYKLNAYPLDISTESDNPVTEEYYDVEYNGSRSDSFTINFPHNADGTATPNLTITLEFKNEFEYASRYAMYFDGTGYNPSWEFEYEPYGYNHTFSSTMQLDPLIKQATLLTATNFTDEENPVITYFNMSANNVDKLEACISLTGGKDDVPYREISKTGSSYTFSLTEDEKNVLRKAAINSQSIQVRFYLKTTIKGVTYFDYLTRNFTVANCNPIIKNPTIREVNSTAEELTGNPDILIRQYSMVEFGFEPIASKYATIASQSVTCGSKKVSGMNYGVIDDIESGTFVFSATDSRGLTTERVIEKPVVEYVKPTCYQSFDTELVGETGASIKLTINGNYFNGTFGAVKNTFKIEVRFTDNNGVMSEWTELLVDPRFNGNTYEVDVTFNGFDYSKSYTFQSRVIDKLYTVQSSQYTVRLLPIFDWSENDFNFNVPVNVNGDTVLSHNRDAKNTILSASNHVYVRPGGPSDTSSQTIFYSNGNVEFSGEVIANGEVLGGAADFVVETGTASMGTNGTWYWTKWNSGKAECYGKRNFGNMAITTAWGGLYRSEALTQTLPSGLFKAIPEVISIDLINSNYGGWIVRHESTAPTASNTGSFIVVRPASATITPSNIGFNVIGRWK